jgi:hypothetical protein
MVAGMLTFTCLLWTIGPVPSDVVPINQCDFQIPIRIDPARRDEIKELQLFYSMDQGRTWQQNAVATPDSSSFAFHAPTDGTYWFSVCVVDRKGNREPRDINAQAPGQKVLIDTLRPVIRIVSAERQGDDVTVAWEIQEDHPDFATIKLDYRTPDVQGWVPAGTAIPQMAIGQTRFRIPGGGPAQVRLQILDLAGNQGMGQAEVKGSSSAPVAAADSGPRLSTGMAPAPLPTPVPPTTVGTGQPVVPNLPSLPVNGGAPAVRTSNSEPNPDRGVQAQAGMQTSEPRFGPTGPTASPIPSTTLPGESGTRLVASTEPVTSPTAPPVAPTSPRLPRGPMQAIQMTNCLQVTLDYEVTKLGPSGLGSVDLYVTQDDGRTWNWLANDPDLKPPITAELPGEGVYGFWLVVKSKVGKGRRPPQSGDLPQMKLEVDTTPPFAELNYPEPVPQRRDALLMTWKATDRNMGPNPITLQWAERPEGPWQSIATDIPNSGRFIWNLPQRIPEKVYLRLTVRDTAGNVSVAETPEPIIVDLNEPEGQLKGVITAPRPTGQ